MLFILVKEEVYEFNNSKKIFKAPFKKITNQLQHQKEKFVVLFVVYTENTQSPNAILNS